MLCNKFFIRVVIPARFGSSRLPGKPLIDIAGKPMIVRVYERVNSTLPTLDIVVAIDDNRIAKVLDEYKIPYIFTQISHESGTDRCAEVARLCKWNDDDLIVNVQGDEPLLPIDLLVSFVKFCHTIEKISIATIGVPLESQAQIFDSNIVKLSLNKNEEAIAFTRAPFPFNRDLPKNEWPLDNYYRHVGIYAYRNSILQYLTASSPCALEKIEKLEQLRAQWLSVPIRVMQWHTAPPHGVDTASDLEVAVKYFLKS